MSDIMHAESLIKQSTGKIAVTVASGSEPVLVHDSDVPIYHLTAVAINCLQSNCPAVRIRIGGVDIEDTINSFKNSFNEMKNGKSFSFKKEKITQQGIYTTLMLRVEFKKKIKK